MDIHIDRGSDAPLYIQIRNQIREALRRGDLAEGQRLPPERQLAAELGVNRTTIVNAYRELAADGLVEAHVGRGTVISRPWLEDAPDQSVRPVTWAQQFAAQSQWPHATLVQEAAELAAQPGVISFASGVPTPELYPAEAFQQAALDFFSSAPVKYENSTGGEPDPNRHAKARATNAGHENISLLLANCPTEGYYALRQWLAGRMGEEGIRTTPDHILITTGATQALDLIARAFIEQDDCVVVETPTPLGAYQRFHTARARLTGIPLDSGGMRVDALEDTLDRCRPKFIYTLPTFQNPTGLTLEPARRVELLRLAGDYGVPVVEDDPYSALSYEGIAPPPLKALDEHGHVIYLGTFSKLLFPGLRLGWIAAPHPVIERLARIKRGADLFTGTLAQGIALHYLEHADWQKYLDGLRATYRLRRDAMVDALRRYGPPGLRWQTPKGGFYLWVYLPEECPARRLLAEAGQTGVAFLPGEAFCVDGGGQHAIRLNFSYAGLEAIEEGIRRLGRAISNVLARQREWADHPATTRAIV